MTAPDVNPGGKVAHEINIKRLGEQQKAVLRFLYRNSELRHQQVEIIESVCGEVTNSRKASMSRSVNRLIEAGLVDERKTVYSQKLEYWVSHRVNYCITDEGMRFVETDSRFPQIGGGEP